MKTWTKEEMAKEAISLVPNKSIINLGIGLPTLIAGLTPKDKNIIFHSENGVLGVGASPSLEDVSPTLINAGKETISVIEGASYFHSANSFAMIRGGHIDAAILGAMEVDTQGNLANWSIPGKKITGMGGAMDLVNGPKLVIAMTYHFNKNNQSKLVNKCRLPLTGKSVVHLTVTDYGVFEICNQKGKFKVLKVASKEAFNSLDQSLFYE